MSYTRDSLVGFAMVGGSVLLTNTAGVIGIATSVLIFGYWVMKCRNAWKHRND